MSELYQVTAMYGDAEVAYAEDTCYQYAIDDAACAVPEAYPEDEVVLRVTCDGELIDEISLKAWQADTCFANSEKEEE